MRSACVSAFAVGVSLDVGELVVLAKFAAVGKRLVYRVHVVRHASLCHSLLVLLAGKVLL
jgi:hypothetical protein